MAKNFLDPDTGLLYKRRTQRKLLAPLERELIEPDWYSDQELYAARGGILTFDLEIYPNYFLAAFKNYTTNKVVTFEIFPGKDVFDSNKLLWVLHNFCLVGFNSNKFDIPITWLALKGATLDEINDAVIQIIKFGAMPRDIENKFLFKMGKINTIDLIEVAPLQGSLKTYGGRLNSSRLQDLPFDPETYLSEEQANKVKYYCINDLDVTALLLKELEPQLSLRAAMSDQYKQDLRSKSDAQIAEAVITNEVKILKGSWSKRPKIEPRTTFKYQIPDYLSYKSDILNETLELLRSTDFTIKENGGVKAPSWLYDDETEKSHLIKLGYSTYRMGTGGLHSTEESICHHSDENFVLIDRDVASYYPRIILNQQLYPAHLGEEFLTVYNSIVERRLAAKKAKDSVVADSLKICVNGSFGKLGSKYSNLYSPSLMIQVTMSGQLSLLMLIEMIEMRGISVLSGNTDGIVIKCPTNRQDELNAIIAEWERIANFETEETKYKAVYSKDVNNYIAVKLDNKCKLKGAYAKAGLQKNPTSTICNDAVIELIVNKTPLDETIRNCTDITKFITLRAVKGGGEKNGIYLGKIVRWIYKQGETGTINYVLSGNKVPKSEGACPVMDLPPTFPDWIDYDRYISEAESILYDIGYLKRRSQNKLFTAH